MGTFSNAMEDYRRQLQTTDLQQVYRGLMEYFRDLRSHFANGYPGLGVSRAIQCGYMDLTYFILAPESLKARKLKKAVVFNHDDFRFEIWLSGTNKEAQQSYE